MIYILLSSYIAGVLQLMVQILTKGIKTQNKHEYQNILRCFLIESLKISGIISFDPLDAAIFTDYPNVGGEFRN